VNVAVNIGFSMVDNFMRVLGIGALYYRHGEIRLRPVRFQVLYNRKPMPTDAATAIAYVGAFIGLVGAV
jgi:hypothetical protein